MSGYPHPFASAAEMLQMGKATGLSIAAMKRANETVAHGTALNGKLDSIWAARDGCIDRGLRNDGILHGGLSVHRRARSIHQQLLAEAASNRPQPHVVTDWIAVYAMAVNEENAAGGPGRYLVPRRGIEASSRSRARQQRTGRVCGEHAPGRGRLDQPLHRSCLRPPRVGELLHRVDSHIAF